MNAIELLTNDHRTVDKLFQQVKATDESEHLPLFQQIKMDLDVHAHIEETIFYPFLMEEGDEELQSIVKEGIEEHRQAKMFLRELSGLAEGSEKFEPKLKVLIEDIEHHVQEEEGEMFKLVEGQVDQADLERLGKELDAEKKKVRKTMSAGSGK